MDLWVSSSFAGLGNTEEVNRGREEAASTEGCHQVSYYSGQLELNPAKVTLGDGIAFSLGVTPNENIEELGSS